MKDQKGNLYIIEDIGDFDPVHTFECGQCFRWRRQSDGSYTGMAGNRAAHIRFEPYIGQQAENAVHPDGEQNQSSRCGEAEAWGSHAPEDGRGRIVILEECGKSGMADTLAEKQQAVAFWWDYLDLQRDYGAVKKKLCADDPVMRQAVRAGEGIRILRQDLWETIVSFIISQNNHIPRIRGCIEKLAELFGEPAVCSAHCVWYSLPGPEKLASLKKEDLEPVKLGYRAAYLIETAKRICAEGMPESFEELLQLPGVGPKVANCIALFGLHRTERFPVDVWMERVMRQMYGVSSEDRQAIERFGERQFGELGGFAQQYLFYYIREISR